MFTLLAVTQILKQEPSQVDDEDGSVLAQADEPSTLIDVIKNHLQKSEGKSLDTQLNDLFHVGINLIMSAALGIHMRAYTNALAYLRGVWHAGHHDIRNLGSIEGPVALDIQRQVDIMDASIEKANLFRLLAAIIAGSIYPQDDLANFFVVYFFVYKTIKVSCDDMLMVDPGYAQKIVKKIQLLHGNIKKPNGPIGRFPGYRYIVKMEKKSQAHLLSMRHLLSFYRSLASLSRFLDTQNDSGAVRIVQSLCVKLVGSTEAEALQCAAILRKLDNTLYEPKVSKTKCDECEYGCQHIEKPTSRREVVGSNFQAQVVFSLFQASCSIAAMADLAYAFEVFSHHQFGASFVLTPAMWKLCCDHSSMAPSFSWAARAVRKVFIDHAFSTSFISRVSQEYAAIFFSHMAPVFLKHNVPKEIVVSLFSALSLLVCKQRSSGHFTLLMLSDITLEKMKGIYPQHGNNDGIGAGYYYSDSFFETICKMLARQRIFFCGSKYRDTLYEKIAPLPVYFSQAPEIQMLLDSMKMDIFNAIKEINAETHNLSLKVKPKPPIQSDAGGGGGQGHAKQKPVTMLHPPGGSTKSGTGYGGGGYKQVKSPIVDTAVQSGKFDQKASDALCTLLTVNKRPAQYDELNGLLDKKADPNVESVVGILPLSRCIQDRLGEPAIRALLSAKADPNQRDRFFKRRPIEDPRVLALYNEMVKSTGPSQ